jgi:hypothetical protein
MLPKDLDPRTIRVMVKQLRKEANRLGEEATKDDILEPYNVGGAGALHRIAAEYEVQARAIVRAARMRAAHLAANKKKKKK